MEIQRLRVTPLSLQSKFPQVPKSYVQTQPIKEILDSVEDQSRKFPQIPALKWHPATSRLSKPKPNLLKAPTSAPRFACEFINAETKPPRRIRKARPSLYEPPPLKERPLIKTAPLVYTEEASPRVLTCRHVREATDTQDLTHTNRYQPYNIPLSPRARITLYSARPLTVAHKRRLSCNIYRSKNNNDGDSLERKNLTQSQDLDDFPIEIDRPASTFGEKLNRANWVAKLVKKD